MNTPTVPTTVPTMSTTVPEVLVAAVSELLACQAPILARLRATTDATTVVPADTSNTSNTSNATVIWTEELVAAFCDAIASIVGSVAWETVRPMEAPSEVRFTNLTTGPSAEAPVVEGSPVTWGHNPCIVNGRLVLGEDVCVCLLRQRVGSTVHLLRDRFACPESIARMAWRTIFSMLAEAPGALPGVSVRADPNDPTALIATVEM
jgi:hypothetical protein